MHFRAGVLIFVVSLAGYFNSLENSFHFDDQHYVVENPYLRDIGNLPSFFKSPRYSSFDKSFTAHYRPLVVSSFAVNYAWGGLNPAGYHRVNLFFHAGTAFLVYWVVRGMLAIPPLQLGFPALSAGLIFALHPFNSEVVNYITARSSVMCAFFYLLAFGCWIKYRGAQVQGRGSKGVTPYYVASLLAFLLALLSKETAITLPLVLWVYDRYFLNGGASRFFVWHRDRAYLPFMMLVVVPYLWVRHHYYGAVVPMEWTRDFWIHMVTQVRVLAEYQRLLWIPSGLTLDHDISLSSRLSDPYLWISGAVLISFGWMVYYLSGKAAPWRMVSFFILWFFIVLLPTTLIPLNAILQENRGYLAGVGFFVFVGIALERLRQRDKRVGWAGLIVLLIVYGLATMERNRDWRDEISLWSDAVAKAPASARSHDNLGLAYFNAGQIAKAEAEFLETLRIHPAYFYAHYNLGVVYQNQGRLEEAIRYYRQAVTYQPDLFRAHYNLGLAYKELGRLEEAIDSYREAIALDSRYSFVYNNLGVVYYRKKNYPEAIELFKSAIQKDPRYAKAYYNLGNVYYETGDYRTASEMYGAALRIEPAFEKARDALFRVLETMKTPSPEKKRSAEK